MDDLTFRNEVKLPVNTKWLGVGQRKKSRLRTDRWRPALSPTGRDAAGLLSREITGEVSEAAAAESDWRGIENQDVNLFRR